VIGDRKRDFPITDHRKLITVPGAIAQLGERVLCKHEVVGSIPSGSTSRGSRDRSQKSEVRNQKIAGWRSDF
jgi:hypothetical protein